MWDRHPGVLEDVCKFPKTIVPKHKYLEGNPRDIESIF